jgi:hypothetical protein
MSYANEERQFVAIDISTAASNSIITAPGAGKQIYIDFLTLNPSGGANTVTLGGLISPVFLLDDNQPLTFENAIHNPSGVFPCAVNGAFTITLSAATRVTGYAIYRIRE